MLKSSKFGQTRAVSLDSFAFCAFRQVIYLTKPAYQVLSDKYVEGQNMDEKYAYQIRLTGVLIHQDKILLVRQKVDELSNYGFSSTFIDLVRDRFPNSGSYMGGKQNIGL